MENKGFFENLFDLSFNQFVTTQLIKILYVLAIILSALGALIILLGSISKGGMSALLGLIFVPVFFCIWVLAARVWLELIIVVFRIAEHTAEIAQQGRSK